MSESEDRRVTSAKVHQAFAMLSGPPGPRAYDAVKHHCHPAARMVRTGVDDAGKPFATVMTVDEHHADVDRKFAAAAPLGEEIDHHCEDFGNVAGVRSDYRSVYGSTLDAREGRGANFHNSAREDDRWRLMSIVCDNERMERR